MGALSAALETARRGAGVSGGAHGDSYDGLSAALETMSWSALDGPGSAGVGGGGIGGA